MTKLFTKHTCGFNRIIFLIIFSSTAGKVDVGKVMLRDLIGFVCEECFALPCSVRSSAFELLNVMMEKYVACARVRVCVRQHAHLYVRVHVYMLEECFALSCSVRSAFDLLS